jgi:lipopolysaccharide/colanic/teichoic acid biosynthesis glycosyltransferase
MKNIIIEKAGQEVCDFFSKFIDLDSLNTIVVSTTNEFNIINNPNKYTAIANLSRVNNIRFINKFFEKVNGKLDNGDFFIGCFETFSARRSKKWINKVPVLRSFYFGFEFIFTRVFPKVWGLKKIYFFFTQGRNRLLSKAEVLGRLVCCGFEIIETQSINGRLYFVTKKRKEPEFNMSPSYSLLFGMKRIGKNGKIIKVYKLRTMHPFSEYLQQYMIKTNGYDKDGFGKINNDFRTTSYGKFLRKYWLDEIPQIINVLKGEMKIVGVRPLSQTRFDQFPEDFKEERKKHKPGCIPPYVALLMSSETENIEAERIYINDKKKKPYTTDIKYFFMAVYNILSGKIRSA